MTSSFTPIAIVACLSAPTSANAFEDVPRADLWTLVDKSAVIVIGTAKQTAPTEYSISVEQTLKGKDVPNAISFGRHDNSWHDYGNADAFEDDDRPIREAHVLAFFASTGESAANWTLMPWGIVQLRTGEDRVFASTIKSAVAAPCATATEKRAWLLECLKSSTTRGNCIASFHTETARYERGWRSPLSSKERSELADAFVREPTIDASFLAVLRLVDDDKSDAFDHVALDVVETLLTRQAPPELWLGDAYPALMERLGEKKAFPILAGEVRPFALTAIEVRAHWSSYKKRHPELSIKRIVGEPRTHMHPPCNDAGYCDRMHP